MTDIFAISRLAFTGYSLQAATLASSSFESAFMIMYVGANNDKAKQWSENQNPFKSAIGVKSSVKKAMECKGFTGQDLEDETNKFYEAYKQMCSIKHVNVYIQGSFQHRVSGDTIRLEYGADTEPRSIRLSAWTLIQFFILFLGSSHTLVLSHIEQPKQDYILARILILLTQSQELVKNVNDYAINNKINLQS